MEKPSEHSFLKVYPNTEPLPDCQNEESLVLNLEHLSHLRKQQLSNGK